MDGDLQLGSGLVLRTDSATTRGFADATTTEVVVAMGRVFSLDSSAHELFDVLITSGEAAMLTTAHDSSIRQVGTQRWLHKLTSQRQHRQHFSTLQAVSGLCAVSVAVGSGRAFAEALLCTAVQALVRCWRLLAAQL